MGIGGKVAILNLRTLCTMNGKKGKKEREIATKREERRDTIWMTGKGQAT